jgi:hypothetical protein
MSAFNMSNVRELVGHWSCLTLFIGLAGGAVSVILHPARNKDSAKVSAALATAMLVFGVFTGTFGVALGMGYSGPTPEYVEVRLFDRYFAALMAFAFALVFALDTFWLSRRKLRSQ